MGSLSPLVACGSSHLVGLVRSSQGDSVEGRDNLVKHPQVHMALMEELKESLLHGGGTEEDWKDLVERPNLPGWAVKWSSVLNEDYAERLAEMCSYYLKPNTLVEVEVRSTEDDKAIGRAILQIKEIKNPRSQWAAKVRLVASDEASFTDWGVLHFDDLQDFEVHFCKKAGCSIKPGAKSYRYFHVGRMRVLPVSDRTACRTS